MSESLIFNFSSTQDARFDRLRTEIYSKTPVFKEYLQIIQFLHICYQHIKVHPNIESRKFVAQFQF